MRGTTLYVALALVGFLFIGGCMSCSYNNKFVVADQEVKAAWSKVQSAYQRRADLIPNLVNTVKGAANFEQQTLVSVIEARAKATSIQLNGDDLSPEKIKQFQQAQGALTGALSRLLVVSEQYPTLQANGNFKELMSQLEGTENRIKVERDKFNDVVKVYNIAVKMAPASIFASFLGYHEKGFFEADAGSEKAPDVKFDFDKKDTKSGK